MKISEQWLREWVNPQLTSKELAAQLTMAGLEVDNIYPVAGEFQHVVVAHVTKTAPHPQADKLTICEVNAGKEDFLQIVCGAANVRAGLKVALALPGANLPGDIHIKETKLRGELSQGMLCSMVELGLADRSEGIMELEADAPIGMDLRQYLQLEDMVLEIELTPNRADCLSVFGVAREVSALNQLSLNIPQISAVKPTIDEHLRVHLDAKEACPQYFGRLIRGMNLHATTPLWIKERLRRSGLRIVHPVVDITNFVMLELGQPMHAFDAHKISGDIHIRMAYADEGLTLLDEQKLSLDTKTLVIADEQKLLAIAGVMGGLESAVHAETTDIFLECAYFNPLIIGGVARHYGLTSDSSHRFERGVDPNLQALALERATNLLLDITGGQIGPVTVITAKECLPQAIHILFNPNKVKRLTGIDIHEEKMYAYLSGLGMNISKAPEGWEVDVPSHRFDMSREVDLVEEIIRLHGYDKIISQPLEGLIRTGSMNEQEQASLKIGQCLSSRGFHEVINYSFVDPELQETLYPNVDALRLLNPISSELSDMRVSLWPGLIASMVYNLHRQQSTVKCFEEGVVFELINQELQERPVVAGLLTGESGSLHWSETARKLDFYDLKGDVQALCAALHLDEIKYISAEHPALHPGKTAKIRYQEAEIGWIGVLHPRLLDALDLTAEVVLFELFLDKMLVNAKVRYQPLSKFPQIRRDLSFLVDKNITALQIEHAVKNSDKRLGLKSFDVFDVYIGDSIPADQKSVAISMTFQDEQKTLVESEINEKIDAILNRLKRDFSVQLRESL